MFGLNSQHRFFLYPEPCDMRKGFNGLSGIVSISMQKDILSGDVFIFINRPRNRMKLLQWQQGGFVLYYKRLEQGTFEYFETEDKEILWTDLVMLIEGINIEKSKKRKRYLSKKNVN